MNEYQKQHEHYKDYIGISKTRVASKEYEIGITNQYDASVDLSIFDRLRPIFNIIITRDLSSSLFLQKLLEHKTNIILHVIVNGFGNTPMEPYSPHPRKMFMDIQRLIASGFPKNQIILRIDPVIPNEQGISALKLVLETFSSLRIKRCRIRLFHCNKNVYTRVGWNYLNAMGFPNPYYREVENKIYKSAAAFHISQLESVLKEYEHLYEFETCERENLNHSHYGIGCVSNKDLRVFGVTDVDLQPNFERKDGCLCPVNVVELQKPSKEQCKFKCLHCTKKSLFI